MYVLISLAGQTLGGGGGGGALRTSGQAWTYLEVTGSPCGGRGQTICSTPFFSHKNEASEIKLTQHKAGRVVNIQ